MKMTRLEWRYLQKIALDHPYYDTHKLPLTEAEAKAIVAENNTMTGREFVDSVYTKLGETRPEEKKRLFGWLHGIGELLSVPPIRRIAIAILVVVLLIVFYTATPIGRTVAENVVKYTITLLKNNNLALNWHGESPVTQAPPDSDGDETRNLIKRSTEFEKLNSFAEFTEKSRKTLIALPLPLSELHYAYDRLSNDLELYAVYEMPEGKIMTIQSWYAGELMTDTTTGIKVYDADERIYYSIDQERERIICEKILSDSVFCIVSNGNYTLRDLIKLLNH